MNKKMGLGYRGVTGVQQRVEWRYNRGKEGVFCKSKGREKIELQWIEEDCGITRRQMGTGIK